MEEIKGIWQVKTVHKNLNKILNIAAIENLREKNLVNLRIDKERKELGQTYT